MRLTAKLALAWTVGVLVALLVQAWVGGRHARAVLVAEGHDDLHALSEAVGGAVSSLWAHQGEEAARTYLEELEENRPHLSLTLVPAGETPAPGRGIESDDAVTMTVSVTPEGSAPLELILVRSLAVELAAAEEILWTQAELGLGVFVVCGLLSLALGVFFVGRPVAYLVEHAREMGQGRFEVPPKKIRQRDEIGRLAREMRLASELLREARTRESSARRARTEMLGQLRHADRLSTVGKLASGIAHELGTPLNVISGRAAMIAASPEVDESVADNARIVGEQATHMTTIIRQLLDFSRRKSLTRSEVVVGDLFESVAMLVEPLADDAGVEVLVSQGGDLRADIDRGKTLQVLTNLAVNAIHAMPDGGELTLGAELVDVDEPPDSRAAPGSYLRLDVIDEGTGIDREELETIFEPFFTTKGAGVGTGLGLPVCHGIVREHGGFIEVESEIGEGSAFRVFLPLTEVPS